jgi:hypothetical protein
LDKHSNVAYIRTVAGFNKFVNYCRLVNNGDRDIQCYDTHVIPPDGKEEHSDDKHSDTDTGTHNLPTTEGAEPINPTKDYVPEGAKMPTIGTQHMIDFDNLPTAPDLANRDNLTLDSTQDELYRWHICLGHIPFSRLKIMAHKRELRNFHHFRCPVYQLNSALANGKSLNKWKSWAQLGINLGPSPTHACSVTLVVLNTLTGLVSPHFSL